MLITPILLALLLAYSNGLSNHTLVMGTATYSISMNRSENLTDDKYFTGFYNSTNVETTEESPREYLYLPSDVKVPEEMDWRLAGAVSRVKNQGRCNCCYAFSATGALEAQYFFKFNKLVPLSEQNIIDCTFNKKYKYMGCEGGSIDLTFQFIIDNQGIATELFYTYQENLSSCLFSANNTGARMSSYVNLPPGNETELQRAVALIGPVAVIVDDRNLRNYTGGIFNDPSCSSNYFSHSMLLVGYGRDGKDEYWIVKNSWGVKWGEHGYIRMTRNKGNQCGIATAALYPVV